MKVSWKLDLGVFFSNNKISAGSTEDLLGFVTRMQAKVLAKWLFVEFVSSCGHACEETKNSFEWHECRSSREDFEFFNLWTSMLKRMRGNASQVCHKVDLHEWKLNELKPLKKFLIKNMNNPSTFLGYELWQLLIKHSIRKKTF